MTFDDKLSEAMDLEKPLNRLADAISTASCTETDADFEANITAALEECGALYKALKRLTKLAGKPSTEEES